MKTKSKVKSEWVSGHEKAVEDVRNSVKAMSRSAEYDWNKMYESGMIDEIVDECRKRLQNRGMNSGDIHSLTVFTVLQAHRAWDYGIAWARDRIGEAF